MVKIRSNINSNSKASSNEVYGKTVLTSHTGEHTNAYTYQKMKNKIQFGNNSRGLLNNGKKKVVK